jgi:hypothetical protein
MARYKSPFLLPDEHMRLVGIIAAHWESVDLILQRAVAEVMSMKFKDVRLLTENLLANAKFDLIIAHARALPKDEFKAINKVIGLVKEAYGLRNAFVHAKWHSDGPSTVPWRFSVRTRGGRISIVQAPTHPSEMETAAEKIWAAGQTLTSILQQHGLLQS